MVHRGEAGEREKGKRKDPSASREEPYVSSVGWRVTLAKKIAISDATYGRGAR